MTAGFFSSGIRFALPHPSVSERIILLVCKVIDKAWALLEREPDFDFSRATENEITEQLKFIIENRLRKNGEVKGFNHKTFGKVTRDSKIRNFNGENPDKMPDLFFDLQRDDMPVLSDQDGLFIECKPVDGCHSLASCYLRKGVRRFVVGDYAWAMREAMMVGYINPNQSFEGLKTELQREKALYLNTIRQSCHSTSVYQTEHQRLFNWVDNRGQAVPIKVYHLWKIVPVSIIRSHNGNG